MCSDLTEVLASPTDVVPAGALMKLLKTPLNAGRAGNASADKDWWYLAFPEVSGSSTNGVTKIIIGTVLLPALKTLVLNSPGFERFGPAPLGQYHRFLPLLPNYYRLCQSRRRDSATPRAN